MIAPTPTPSPDQVPPSQFLTAPSLGMLVKGLAILLLPAAVMAVLIWFLQMRLGDKVLPEYWQKWGAVPSPSPTAAAPQPYVTVPQVTDWAIVVATGSADVAVVSDAVHYAGPKVYRWGDWLIYPHQLRENPYNFVTGVDIMAHKIGTGRSEKWYSFTNEQSSDKNPELIFSMMQLFGDRLFVGIGGNYGSPSKLYWMDLASRAPAQSLDLKGYLLFQEKHGRQWLTANTGEGCGGVQTYYRFSPLTNPPQAEAVIESHEGCVQGLRVVDTYREQLVVAEAENQQSDEGVLKNLELWTLASPSAKTTLLTHAQMPPDVRRAYVDEARNQIILLGKQVYSFDIQTRELQQTQQYPSGWENRGYSSSAQPEGDSLCFHEAQKKLFLEYSLAEHKWVEPLVDCLDFKIERLLPNPYANEMQKLYGRKFAELDLPSNYSLEFTTKVYR